jgi:formamidopyrimidine-DNA glycosylase
MPELPEVETVRRGLEPVLAGARLKRVRANRPDLRFPLPDGFVQRLTGATIQSVDRRAKYLLMPLDRGDTLVAHLGMTGRFEIEDHGRTLTPGEFVETVHPLQKHAHVVFETEAGVRITYYDPRRFGFMDLISTDQLTKHAFFKGMGPEPLGADLDVGVLERAFKDRKQGPKTLLLDQRIVAGLGNIYVCEALNRSRISPFKPAGKIARKRLPLLVETIKDVLAEAVEAGGSTLKDFAATDGALGYFQHRFKVYDREGEPCLNEGCGGVIDRQVQAGRSTFYCPVCQV